MAARDQEPLGSSETAEATKAREETVAGFAGIWNVATISEDCSTATWPDGEVARVDVVGERIELRLNGEVCHGQLESGHIRWDDGDVWVRSTAAERGAVPSSPSTAAPAPQALGTTQEDEERKETVTSFAGIWSEAEISEDCTTATWPDGEVYSITVTGLRIELTMESEVFSGQLVAGQIRWDDGDMWVRSTAEERAKKHRASIALEKALGTQAVEATPAPMPSQDLPAGQPAPPETTSSAPASPQDVGFAGLWSEATISENCTIATWKNGDTSKISVDGDKIVLTLDDEDFVGRLDGDQIRWEDGDIWERISPEESRSRQRYATALERALNGGGSEEEENVGAQLPSGEGDEAVGFAGVWSEATISDDLSLATFANGETSDIKVDGEKIELILDGDAYHGKLNGVIIEWDDGDVWTRTSEQERQKRARAASALEKALAGGSGAEEEDISGTTPKDEEEAQPPREEEAQYPQPPCAEEAQPAHEKAPVATEEPIKELTAKKAVEETQKPRNDNDRQVAELAKKKTESEQLERKRKQSVRKKKAEASQAKEAANTVFLPTTIRGFPVLIKMTNDMWRVDNSQLQSRSPGLCYRVSKDHEDRHPQHGVKYGEMIQGFDEGDGWVRCKLVPTEELSPKGKAAIAGSLQHSSSAPTFGVKSEPVLYSISTVKAPYSIKLTGRTANGAFAEAEAVATPGPGSYEAVEAGRHSKYVNAPGYSCGGANRFDLAKNPAKMNPAPGHYELLHTNRIGGPQTRRVGFGLGPEARGQAYRVRQLASEPGPGHYEPGLPPGHASPAMTMRGRLPPLRRGRSTPQPGPGAYDPSHLMTHSTTVKVGFGTSPLEDYVAKHEKKTPGPGTYDLQYYEGVGNDAAHKYSLISRRHSYDLEGNLTPGPGEYNSHATIFPKPVKATRRQVKSCSFPRLTGGSSGSLGSASPASPPIPTISESGEVSVKDSVGEKEENSPKHEEKGSKQGEAPTRAATKIQARYRGGKVRHGQKLAKITKEEEARAEAQDALELAMAQDEEDDARDQARAALELAMAQDEEEESRDKAATRIQARYRGGRARKDKKPVKADLQQDAESSAEGKNAAKAGRHAQRVNSRPTTAEKELDMKDLPVWQPTPPGTAPSVVQEPAAVQEDEESDAARARAAKAAAIQERLRGGGLAASEEQPPAATEGPSPAATQEPPPAATEESPPAATDEAPPASTEEPTSPQEAVLPDAAFVLEAPAAGGTATPKAAASPKATEEALLDEICADIKEPSVSTPATTAEAAALAGPPSPEVATSPEDYPPGADLHVVSNTDREGLAVFSAPSSDSEILWRLPNDTVVELGDFDEAFHFRRLEIAALRKADAGAAAKQWDGVATLWVPLKDFKSGAVFWRPYERTKKE